MWPKVYLLWMILLVIIAVLDLTRCYNELNEMSLEVVKRLDLKKSLHYSRYSSIFAFNQTKQNTLALKQIVQKNKEMIKNFIVPSLDVYVHEPIADFLLEMFLISKNSSTALFSHRTKANLVTIASCLLAIPIFCLMIHDTSRIGFRRLACALFQTMNVLDFMDGTLARLDMPPTSTNKFDYGRIFDAVGNTLPTFALLMGSYVFILNSSANILHNTNNQDMNKLNVYYRNLHKLVLWLKSKFASKSSPIIVGDKLFRLDALKEVYFTLTLFMFYFITAGTFWNKVLDSQQYLYGDYQIKCAVTRNLIFKIFSFFKYRKTPFLLPDTKSKNKK